VADRQLGDCCRKAQAHGLPIGLYLDVAVGLAKAGADAWACQDELATGLSVGAPPDLYNRAGQDWGIATFHPQVLIETDFALFRQTMREVMRHAGAIRLDHVLGLNRLYLIPDGFRTAEGAYVYFPFDAMLAVAAQESVAQNCLIIGEDLGTVPEGVSEKLGAHGIWSYRVVLFETEHDGRFKPPDRYPARALVTFTTHDLPTLRGWLECHDINTKRALGIDLAEDEQSREQSARQLRDAAEGSGAEYPVSYSAVARFLAKTPSKMVSISLEDVFDIAAQPNLPGTMSEYPNWRQRLPVDLDEFGTNKSLRDIADIMAAEGRSQHHGAAQ
jgi:4-alpha-glucanotransferase